MRLVAATAAAAATLLVGGVASSAAVADDSAEPGLTASKTVTAYAAGCTPFDPTGVVCDASVPTHQLSQGDPADDYKGFTFTTNRYPLDKTVFDDNWTKITRAANPQNPETVTIAMVPKTIGATVKLPDAGTWTDQQGEEHQLDAMFTVTATNGGFVAGYTGPDGVEYGGLSGMRSAHWGGDVSAAEPQPTDDTKRTGIEVKVSFYYAGTDTPVPDTFKGLTGFGDLDGIDGTPDSIEGVELIDGFDGLWLPDDPHLTTFGDNGYGGSDECQDQTNLDRRHAQQHMFTAAFSGPSFTVRYSQGLRKSTYAMVFGAPLLADQLVYKVTAHAVDEQGNEIKTPWTVADGLRVNGTYELTDIPDIDGYEYVGPAGDSAPLKGGVTVDGKTEDRTVTLVYKRIPASIHYDPNGGTGETPDTNGGQGEDVTLTPNGFTRDCWLFDSWNTKKDGTGTRYTDRQAVTLKGDVTLYAQWKRDAACKAGLVYDRNSDTATGETKGQTGWKGDTVTVEGNGFTNEGYAFTGWNAQADGKGKAYGKGDKLNLPAGTTTLYAQWERIPGTVSWVKTDKDTGEVLAGSEWTLTAKDGQPVTIVDNGDLDQDDEDGAFRLTGLEWGDYELMETKAPDGHDPISRPIAFTVDARHTTVTIGDVGNTRTPATVTYDPNGGTGDTPGYEGHVGDTPDAAGNGFRNGDCKTFTGWNTQADGKGRTYKAGDPIDPLTGDLTLYAQWEDKADCPVLQQLGRTGSAVIPLVAVLAVAVLMGVGLMVLRHGRRGHHA